MTRTPTPSPLPARRVLTARSPDDLLAAVPVVLGFEPDDSAVMLTFGGAHTFHARVDLPRRASPADADAVARDLEAMTDLLLEPARRHRVASVAFVLYTDDADLARRVARSLERRFSRCGIEIHAVFRADGRRWYLTKGVHGVPAHGVPYDLSVHPFRVQSVVDGQVTHTSRDELAATLETDEEASARVAGAVAEAHGPGLDAIDVASCVAHHITQGTTFTDQELAATALAIPAAGVREAAWGSVRRETAQDHVRLWTDAVRRTPADLAGSPAAVLAFSAWLAGHGALAWCAVDIAEAADPGNSLAELVAQLLTAAVPPATWSPEALAG